MSLKQRIKILLYDFVKVCPPARRLVRHMLFQYREITFRRHTKGIATDPNLMVFCTFSGRGYSDSPRAIFEYMANRPEEYGQYRYVWIFQHPERFRWLEEQYPNTTVLQWASVPYQRAMAAAKYWVFNYRVSDHIWPKKDQVYLECWHGTPLKRLGYDLQNEGGNVMNSLKEVREKYDLDAAKFRYILSPSEFTTEKFTSAWNLKQAGKENAILQEGYPRNDYLLNHTPEDVEQVKRALHIHAGGHRRQENCSLRPHLAGQSARLCRWVQLSTGGGFRTAAAGAGGGVHHPVPCPLPGGQPVRFRRL